MNNSRIAGPDPGKGKAVVESFKFKGRVYELRLNSCGKQNCHTCLGNIPKHGPYWYLCVPWGGKWRRIYIGKDLDTTKYIEPDGKVFSAKSIRNWQKALTTSGAIDRPATPRDDSKPSEPHQADMLEEAAAQPPSTFDDVPKSLYEIEGSDLYPAG